MERQYIEIWMRHKLSYREMARRLKRCHSIIVREVHRNSSVHIPYTAGEAERITAQRKRRSRRRKIDRYPQLARYIVQKMTQDYWSPGDIAGRLHNVHEQIQTDGIRISHESIYHWIYTGNGKQYGLYPYLHYKRPHRRYRHVRKKRLFTGIPERISIHERPEIVHRKIRFGDWESDTMVFSKQPECLSVQYERKSKLVRIHRMNNKSADETHAALSLSIESLSQGLFKTITFDNGLEGVRHTDIRDTFALDTYFCDPYASWQKGGVENMNKWIRRFLPRQITMRTLSDDDITIIQERLNNKPRRSLGYRTPNELLQQELIHDQSGA